MDRRDLLKAWGAGALVASAGFGPSWAQAAARPLPILPMTDLTGGIDGRVRFDHAAPSDAPYMYHCHILEHEDCGMMGQFTVS